MGGVAIPERHSRRDDEHLRLLAKQDAGYRFFVTQVVYDINAAKNLVSDYRYACAVASAARVPIVFTFSVCGSMRTLQFLRWLGVDVPRWIENDLRARGDSARRVVGLAPRHGGRPHRPTAGDLGVPFGLNVESVSIRRVEIDAAVELATGLSAHIRV